MARRWYVVSLLNKMHLQSSSTTLVPHCEIHYTPLFSPHFYYPILNLWTSYVIEKKKKEPLIFGPATLDLLMGRTPVRAHQLFPSGRLHYPCWAWAFLRHLLFGRISHPWILPTCLLKTSLTFRSARREFADPSLAICLASLLNSKIVISILGIRISINYNSRSIIYKSVQSHIFD